VAVRRGTNRLWNMAENHQWDRTSVTGWSQMRAHILDEGFGASWRQKDERDSTCLQWATSFLVDEPYKRGYPKATAIAPIDTDTRVSLKKKKKKKKV